MFIRSAHNYDTNQASVGIDFVEESKTQQHFRDQCDINRIVKQFGVTGQVTARQGTPIDPGEFISVTDYHTSLNAVKRAHSSFNELPALVRERFQNDHQKFVDFVLDPANNDEAVALGLAVKRASQTEVSSTLSPTPQGAAEGGAQ